MSKPVPTPVPTRKISETILDFAVPMFEDLGEVPSLRNLRDGFKLVILIWNAHAMAMDVWGAPEHLADVRRIAHGAEAIPQFARLFEALSLRRLELFRDDPRVVGQWHVDADGDGGFRFHCDARIPQALKRALDGNA